MTECPACGNGTEKRMALIEPSELREERDYCLTCEKFVEDDARPPSGD